jgi:GxxExxY protein
MELTSKELTENEISKILLNIFISIHKQLGPGLLESVYEEVICHELTSHGLEFERQKGISVFYNSIKMDVGFRADIIVSDKVIIEIKSVEQLAPVHHKQLLTYLKLTDKKLGILVNFNVNLVKDGIVGLVNNFIIKTLRTLRLCEQFLWQKRSNIILMQKY